MSISSTGDHIPSVQDSDKAAPEEHFGHVMGYDRTKHMESGGLFILCNQDQCKEASTLTRIGHAVLGAAKAAGAIAFVATGAWLVAQTFTAMTSPPVVLAFCGLAMMVRDPSPIIVGVAYLASPTILVGVLLKSAYHDFKLSATGKA